MKITLYTIKDCAFSKQEKEYLNTNKLAFEEKDLETNKDFLTEMLAISNNFAGTPVTRVEKDDGTIAVLKGFTKEEFDTTFGFASPEPKAEAGSVVPPVTDVPPVTPTESVSPAPVPAADPSPVTPQPTMTQTPPETPVKTDDPLRSVMDDLKEKAQPVVPPIQPVADSAVTIPPPAGAPTIPDFPAK